MFMLGFGLHPIVMIVFWIVVVALGIWLLSELASGAASTSVASNAESALDILNRRYARGEISKADYEAMRRDLES